MDAPGRVRALREGKGLTLTHVALVAELDPATVSRVERSLVEPQRETVAHIAGALHVAPKRLWALALTDWEDSTRVVN
jgi:transcriptional regulator with XRE-family HTH domain